MKKNQVLKTLGIAGLALCLSGPIFAQSNSEEVWITIGSDAISGMQKNFSSNKLLSESKASRDGVSLIKVNSSLLSELSHYMHEEFNRCGGFMLHDSLESAEAELYSEQIRSFANKSFLQDYSIDQEEVVNPLIANVKEANIAEVIRKLSSFKNRYYKSVHGQNSQKWLKEYWEKLAQGRSDIKVEYIKHKSWPQPSVVMTIEGASSDIIVVGGHADSISGYWRREENHAPGADDNASGIATVTEVIRSLIDASYRPEKTIKFMGYAAEEVGLLGSKEIARSMRQNNAEVIGVLQLDMTNYNGSADDITLMQDFTNESQNAFIGNLIDHYFKGTKWGYDRCGYGCSDHASWHSQGYPASIPFEARMNDMNGKIHTPGDTIEVSGGNAMHATKFAKLALAYLVELDR